MSSPPAQHSPTEGASSPVTAPTLYSPVAIRAHGQRYLKITAMDNGFHPGQTESFQRLLSIMKEAQGTALHRGVPLPCNDSIRMHFDSKSDASEACNTLQQRGFHVVSTTQHNWAMAKFLDSGSRNESEGQVVFNIAAFPVHGHTAGIQDIAELSNIISIFCEKNLGRLHSCAYQRMIPGDNHIVFSFRLEFDSVLDSIRCVKILAQAVPDMLVNHHQPMPVPLTDMASRFRWMVISATFPNASTISMQPQVLAVMYTTIRHPAEQNNCVLRNNVVNGLDVRGTLMLRNIPNKMDYLSLLAILNEYCFGMYDFAYLRKDFKTGLNVGYGFVNFCHTDGVLAILDNMANRRWAGHASNRPCEVSYATVQGLDALVNKFRNSSVMKEPESSKPHLFVTYEEALIQGSIALVGTQIPFPAPNNATKLHRSEESKVQYGLYPPHHGGNAVAHRNRNSQYDHGNPRDIEQIDEFYHGFSHNFLDPRVQRNIETWYAKDVNGGFWLPFSHIPVGFRYRYCEIFPFIPNNGPRGYPGPIARPNGMAHTGRRF